MRFKETLTMADFVEMHKLEGKYYDESHITPVKAAWEWHLKFPEYNVVLEDEQAEDGPAVIGFLDMFPVSEAIFEELKAGVFNDADLTAEGIVSMDGLQEGDIIHMFLCCIVVEEEYRKTAALKMLLKKNDRLFPRRAGQGRENRLCNHR